MKKKNCKGPTCRWAYLDFYNEHVTNEDITSFEDVELAPQIDMVG